MTSSYMRAAASVAAVAAAAITGTTATAHAADAVHIDASEVFDGGSTFTSDITGCGSGTVTNGSNSQLHGGPRFGKFNGFKIFECASGDVFVVRLSAKFDDTGSVGTWSIIGGTGDLAGLRGSGTLVGTPIPGGINDVYDGTLRP